MPSTKCTVAAVCATALCGVRLDAQNRVAILQAEGRRAPTAQDVALMLSGARSQDGQTVRLAVRAMGRLERPVLIVNILPALQHPLPEVRSETANAIAQAAQGWTPSQPMVGKLTIDLVYESLVAQLHAEGDPDVRASISEAIGRLPYTGVEQARRAEITLTSLASSPSLVDRLGAAKGLEALVRLRQNIYTPSREAVAALRELASPDTVDPSGGVRVRRLALETLIRARAVDAEVVIRAARDSDAQVRRLAMRAAGGPELAVAALAAGVVDPSPMVRIEALRALRASDSDRLCEASIAATRAPYTEVVLVALDQMAACASSEEAVALLERVVSDLSGAGAVRAWHPTAHALVALATAAPDRAARALRQVAGSGVWQLRLYAARAATMLKDRPTLEALAMDFDDNVREAAIDGLAKVAGHQADAVYIAELARSGYQVLRSAANALEGAPPSEAAVAALEAVLARLVAEGHDNSTDVREAIIRTLVSLGAAPATTRRAAPKGVTSELSADDLRRLAAPRARITIRDVGTIEVALITAEAPATVVRFARLVRSGYYDGLTFHRVEPNFVVQGGSPGANEFIGDAAFMRDELGQWPHVRGTVGLSTRGRDSGDAQFFIDLVDSPRFDHVYTVFGQVLNGIELIDQILEGDIIQNVEILAN
jgi:cyclophilin family peptidyl-prolyl cis-trans isomerase